MNRMGGRTLDEMTSRAGHWRRGVPASRRTGAWLAFFLIGGCDSVRDVIEAPAITPPTAGIVLQGTITGLGSRRPVVLQYNGQDVCADAAQPQTDIGPCRFYGIPGQSTSTFSFGALPRGTAYHITVRSQPFGKQCHVENAEGILGQAPSPPRVICHNDASVPRFPVTVRIAPQVAAIPSAKVRLTTEEGEQVLSAHGASSLTFTDALFDSQDNLPAFTWSVTATVEEGGTVNNCHVSGGTNESSDPQGQETTQPPGGPEMDVEVTTCRFTVTATVAYQPAPGQPTRLMSPGGIELALRRSRTGENEKLAELPGFGIAHFTDISSNRDAIFELAVKRQPQGMACVVGSSSQYQWGSAVLLLDPLDANRPRNHGWVINRNVRCREHPQPDARLRGSFRLYAAPASGGEVTPSRNFLTFFDDGTYLYAHHGFGSACSLGCGVEHGFYVYDPSGASISFQPTTDTNGPAGLSAVSQGVAIASPLTRVVRFEGADVRIEADFGNVTWQLIEARSVPGQMTGTWVTADHRRVWIFDGATYNGMHAGVNGLGNVQDGCYNIEDVTAVAGSYTRRGNNTTCALGPGYFTLDVPNAATVPRHPEGFMGKWPQSTSNADGRPSSPVNYLITPGNPDTLRIRETVNGAETLDGITPVSPEILLYRMRAR